MKILAGVSPRLSRRNAGSCMEGPRIIALRLRAALRGAVIHGFSSGNGTEYAGARRRHIPFGWSLGWWLLSYSYIKSFSHRLE
jgi:hypothetical protein